MDMAKIGVLYPDGAMVEDALRLAPDYQMDVVYSNTIVTSESINECREAIDAGAQLVVARGKQARLMKDGLNIPIVETTLTTQEIGLLIEKAKDITKKKRPKIVLICFEGMLSDTTYIASLFQVELEIQYIDNWEEVDAKLAALEDWQPDIVIGGKYVCEYANARGYLSLYYSATQESIAQALQTARHMSEMLETQMQSDAQFETMMDTSFNGIVRVNREGAIVSVNQMVENLTGRKNEKLIGQPLSVLFPELETEALATVLNGESEQYSTSIQWKNEAWMLLIAPIRLDLKVRGAILSIRKFADLKKLQGLGADRKAYLRGYTTNVTFEDILSKSDAMKRFISKAKVFSMSARPVLLNIPRGNHGTLLAKAIHNHGGHKDGPFVSLDLACVPEEEQRKIFMGDGQEGDGIFFQANRGTIYLKNVEHLTSAMQHQIVRLFRPWREIGTDAQLVHDFDIYFIVSTSRNLNEMLEQGHIEPEFYYLVTALELSMPPISECQEDLKELFDQTLRRYLKRYNKYMKVSEGGYRALQTLPWEGNAMQLEAFVERLVLSVNKRIIDESVINTLYRELYPTMVQIDGISSYVTYRSKEEAELEATLREFGGNRKKVAEHLGISTTTLWRKMKKFGMITD